MPNVNASVVNNAAVRNLQVVETIILLAASILVQFLIHLIPTSGTPVGAFLLAMFFAPLIAVIFFKPHTAFVVAILSPIINYLVSGSPIAEILPLMTIKLVLFVSCLYLFFNIKSIKKFCALGAILISITVSPFIVSLFSSYSENVVNTLTTAIPGILLLTLANYFLVRYQEKN